MTAVDAVGEVIEPQAEEGLGSKESYQDRNWAEARNVIKEATERNRRLEQEVESLRRAFEAKSAPPEEDPWKGLEEDDVLEVKHAKAVVGKIAEKHAEKAVKAALEQQRRDPAYLEQQAKARHADYDQVLTPEHIEWLTKNPFMHQAVLKADDPIEAAYQVISESAYYQQKKAVKGQHLVEKAKLKENQAKVKEPQTVAQDQALGSPNHFGRLSKEEKRQLWVDHNKRLGKRI